MSLGEKSKDYLDKVFNIRIDPVGFPEVTSIYTSTDGLGIYELSDSDLIKVFKAFNISYYEIVCEIFDRKLFDKMEDNYGKSKTRKKLEG